MCLSDKAYSYPGEWNKLLNAFYGLKDDIRIHIFFKCEIVGSCDRHMEPQGPSKLICEEKQAMATVQFRRKVSSFSTSFLRTWQCLTMKRMEEEC